MRSNSAGSVDNFNISLLAFKMSLCGISCDSTQLYRGIAHLAMQAMLLGEIEKFDNRLKRIYHISTGDLEKIKEFVESQRRKSSKKKFLSGGDFDMLAFFENLLIADMPFNYHHLYQGIASPIDFVSTALSLTKQQKLSGNIHGSTLFTGAYDFATLQEYIKQAKSAIYNASDESPDALILSSLEREFALIYDFKKNSWSCVDPNHLPSKFISDKDIADHIWSSLGGGPKSEPSLAFSTELFTTGTREKDSVKSFKEWHEAYIRDHLISVRNARCGKDFTVFDIAAKSGDLGTLEALTATEKRIPTPDNPYHKTSLYIASYYGNQTVVKFLLELDPQVNYSTTDGYSPFDIALAHGYLGILKQLSQYGGHSTHKGNPPLTVAANHGYIDIIRFLLDQNADLEACNSSGYTALMIAANKGHEDIVRVLVESGADVNACFPTKNGPFQDQRNVLSMALASGNVSMAKFLYDHGARFDFNMPIDLRRRMMDEVTVLWDAADTGNLELVKYLVEMGVDVNAGALHSRSTPLWAAASAGEVEIVKYLTQHGADITQWDHRQVTPTEIAAKHHHDDVVKFLQALTEKPVCETVEWQQAITAIESQQNNLQNQINEVVSELKQIRSMLSKNQQLQGRGESNNKSVGLFNFKRK